jgi:hypothetical protein
MGVEAPTLRALSSTPQNSTSFLSTGYYHREQIPALAWVMRITVDEVKFQHVGGRFAATKQIATRPFVRDIFGARMAVGLAMADRRRINH